MTERKRSRMPDLELDAEARQKLGEVLARPHTPSAAMDNLGRQRRALGEARQREAQAEEN